MENEPEKWTDQRWSIPGHWFQLVRHNDQWTIESESGFRIPVNAEDTAQVIAAINRYHQIEWEREKEQRKRGE